MRVNVVEVQLQERREKENPCLPVSVCHTTVAPANISTICAGIDDTSSDAQMNKVGLLTVWDLSLSSPVWIDHRRRM